MFVNVEHLFQNMGSQTYTLVYFLKVCKMLTTLFDGKLIFVHLQYYLAADLPVLSVQYSK